MRVIHMVNLGGDVSGALPGSEDDGVPPGPSRSRLFCLLRVETESKWLENS